jgi:hypothetical protein
VRSLKSCPRCCRPSRRSSPKIGEFRGKHLKIEMGDDWVIRYYLTLSSKNKFRDLIIQIIIINRK